ncbi:MAG TPA: GNAT family N-acetyltransferase [Streptosporangiaceae bacterium]|nr:GNAT family N-acetyltransferase [Streptosporangiaceae bacterium]
MATHLTSHSGTDIREIAPSDDLDAIIDLARRAFGPGAATGSPEAVARRRARTGQAIADQRVFGAFAGGRMVASATWHDMQQWWHGRSLPMAGVAAVMVAPEFRGRGVGRTLMTEVLDAIARRGYPLSVLFPATTPIYRSLGWEMAGGDYRISLPARSLRSLLAPDISRNTAGTLADEPAAGRHAVPFARATPDDAAAVLEVIGRAHQLARHSGPNTRDAASAAAWLADPDLYAYLAPDGFLAYRWGQAHEIHVERIVAATERTLRELWAIVASHSSIADTVTARVGPDDPIFWLTREPDTYLKFHEMWMLRLVDVPAAIRGRGFPLSAQLSLPLSIQDDSRDGHAGLWELSVTGGRGTLVHAPEATHPLTIGVRGLAALYAGTPMASLRLAGLASGGDPAADSELDGAFGGASFLLDNF